jgi:hypothetical protein
MQIPMRHASLPERIRSIGVETFHAENTMDEKRIARLFGLTFSRDPYGEEALAERGSRGEE